MGSASLFLYLDSALISVRYVGKHLSRVDDRTSLYLHSPDRRTSSEISRATLYEAISHGEHTFFLLFIIVFPPDIFSRSLYLADRRKAAKNRFQ